MFSYLSFILDQAYFLYCTCNLNKGYNFILFLVLAITDKIQWITNNKWQNNYRLRGGKEEMQDNPSLDFLRVLQ